DPAIARDPCPQVPLDDYHYSDNSDIRGKERNVGRETGTHDPVAGALRLGYRPAFDGLRAVAITLVVPYHWLGDQTGIAGGWLGVNLFFVVSGFLITRLLVEEHARRNSIDAGGFYRRRAARLLPPYMTMLLLVIVLGRVTAMFGSQSDVRFGALSSLF